MDKLRLIIHQPTNHYSNKYRYYNIFFENLIKKISEKHDVVLDGYNKNVHMGRVPVNLSWYDYKDFQIEVQDCELIIENYDTKETQILSVSDDLTPATLNLQSFNNTTKIFISQFLRNKIYHHVKEEYRDKYKPWIYFPSNEYDLDFYFQKRKEIEHKEDKLYFRGETGTRTILDFFDSNILYGRSPIGGFKKYAEELINYKIGLSVAGRGEMCYRDVEYMAMGVPFLRFEYRTEFVEPLIPNYHYISIDRPEELNDWLISDRLGNEEHAKMIMKKFTEVKDDKDFLEFISKNARKYYEDFLSPSSSVNLTIKLLGL